MSQSKKVLLVDDSDVVAGMLTHVLESAGYEIFRAVNGVQGIEMVYKIIPDVIVMDVEMPLLQGYQASRLLKSRRGVRDIPIVMHTSLSEDRDKYWAITSGADEFANKDFDNIDQLLEKISYLADHSDFNIPMIQEDAQTIDQNRIFEMLGTLFDQQLFQSTILNLLAAVGRNIASLTDTVHKILDLLPKVCESPLAILILKVGKRPIAYVLPTQGVYQKDVDEFLSVCLGDFQPQFPNLDLLKLESVYFNIEKRNDFSKMRMDDKSLSSYLYVPLFGKGESLNGTLHLGNFTNNYFSGEKINSNVELFARASGIVLENSILFTQISQMQEKVRNVFSKFVPQEIIDDMVENQDTDQRLMGEKRKVCVLFADIRGFTSISEANTAEGVVVFLNNYLDVMVNIIRKYGGTIDKFIGDAILAIFGAPKSYEDNAYRAVQAALDMVKALKLVKIDNLNLPATGLKIGVGIHEGPAIVGNIGSRDKFDYTVIGDTVNLASRLEGLTKYYHQDIIVSEQLKDSLPEHLNVREIDTVCVKGKDEHTVLYSMLQEPLDAPFNDLNLKALKMYKMGNWETAIEYFTQALHLRPQDEVCLLMLERCREYKVTPPKSWNGAQILSFK